MGAYDFQEHTVRPEFDLADADSGESSDGPVDYGFLPDTVERHCTDVPTLVVLLVALAGLLVCVSYSIMHQQLLHNGDLCGHGQYVGQPFLFFCLQPNASGQPAAVGGARDGGALDMAHPLCVESCPSGPSTSQCRSEATGPIPDYPTRAFIGMFCRPEDPGLVGEVSNWVVKNPEVHGIATASSFVRAWYVLAACALMAVVASYGYIFVLRNCAALLVWAGIIILTVVPLVSSAYYFFCWQHEGGCSVRFGDHQQSDPLIGVLLLVVGLCFLILTIHRGDSVDLAVDCLEASCECVMETNCLRFVPLITFCTRVTLLTMQATMMLLLLSCANSKEVIGTWSRLAPTPLQWAMMLYAGAAFLWLHWVVGSTAEFVTVYAAEMWYFTEDADHEHGSQGCAVWKAYWAALRFHPGTLALGGLIIGITSPVRMVLGPLDSCARTAHTPVGIVIGLVCCCCVRCYDRCLASLNHNAYTEVAMNSKGFCQAANDALRVCRHEEEAVQILNGVTRIFQIFGLCSIAFLGDTLTVFLIKKYYSDLSSPQYIHNPEVIQISGSIIAAVVAMPFLVIFDTVSDTIIFCYSVKKQRRLSEVAAVDVEGCLMGAYNSVSELTHCFGPVQDPVESSDVKPLSYARGLPPESLMAGQ